MFKMEKIFGLVNHNGMANLRRIDSSKKRLDKILKIIRLKDKRNFLPNQLSGINNKDYQSLEL